MMKRDPRELTDDYIISPLHRVEFCGAARRAGGPVDCCFVRGFRNVLRLSGDCGVSAAQSAQYL